MEKLRWTLGVALAAFVSLWGLTEAGAGPFSTTILSDDLGNRVNSSPPPQGEWESGSEDNDGSSAGDTGAGADDGGGDEAGGDDASGGGNDNNGHGNNEDGVDSSNPGGGKDNNGHGNNEDGVDSSNPGKGKGGPNGETDASCDGSGDCIDDEISKSNGGDTSSDSGSTTETKTNNGKSKNKNK